MLHHDELGRYSQLMRDLEDEDQKFKGRFIRHDPPFFAELVRIVGPTLKEMITTSGNPSPKL